jgi:hypothetical protein
MITIEQNSVYENIPAWNVKIENIPTDEIIKSLFNSPTKGREFYQGGNEEVDALTEELKQQANTLIEEETETVIRFVKDSPKYKLIPHYDNKQILGIIMINLVDNASSTIMYSSANEPLYTSSNKKGDGIYYLNDLRCKHGFYNDSEDYRYAIMVSINKAQK